MNPDDEKEPQLIGSAFRAEWERLGLIPRANDSVGVVETPTDPREAVKSQRMERFKVFCPPQFRATIDRAKIKNLEAWDSADEWDGAFPGLWLWSNDTGEAKSRMLWRKFGQMHVERGRTVVRVTGANMAEEYHDCFNRNRTLEFYARLVGINVVLLDDLDKLALPREGLGFSGQEHADRNARMLREVFDRFYEQMTPVLVTANESIAWFGQRIGPSAERRMREVCREIEF